MAETFSWIPVQGAERPLFAQASYVVDGSINIDSVTANAELSALNVNAYIAPNSMSVDAGARLRVSQMNTLFDGKTLNYDNIYIFDSQGTGTGNWSSNRFDLSATSNGQYYIRQAKRFAPYFSRKSQFVECTFNSFHTQPGVVKRVGYFSSSASAPYDTTYDGVWLENDGTTIRLRASRAGTTTVNVPISAWEGYRYVENYDWSKFSVAAFDFLWLGGATLRLFIKTDLGFILCHNVRYVGIDTFGFCLSPSQPIRYEIRSTGGAGSLAYICSHVSTEGSRNEEGYNGSVNTGSTGVALTVAGTTHPLLAIRKQSSKRDISVKLTNLNLFTTTANDQLLWSLYLNPTFTAPLSYVPMDNTAIEYAIGSNSIDLSSTGRLMVSGYVSQNVILPSNLFEQDYLAYLGINLNNSADALVLCGTPITGSITTFGALAFREDTK